MGWGLSGFKEAMVNSGENLNRAFMSKASYAEYNVFDGSTNALKTPTVKKKKSDSPQLDYLSIFDKGLLYGF